MKAKRQAGNELLKPEVMAVIRSAFDGYNEPDKGHPSVKMKKVKPPALDSGRRIASKGLSSN